MMSKISFILSGAVLALSACAMESKPNFTITALMGAQYDNNMAYLYDADVAAKIDSVIVTEGVAKFEGHADSPKLTRIMIGEKRGPYVIMEEGQINVSAEGQPSGSPLNDRFNEVQQKLSEIVAEARKLNRNDSIQDAKYRELIAEYDAIPATVYNENKNNVLGLYMYLQDAYGKSLSELTADMSSNPMLASSAQVNAICETKRIQLETGEGKHYKDFSVEYDGKTENFSSYVKPGRYTLVDFWASWCGPCMRQLKYIKDLYAKYKDKGLDVVGVAVWDKPEDTLEAIKKHALTWPCIINAQTIPTDLYGISGIPCIILINPEGVIVSRGKLGDNLVNDVDEAMAAYEAAKIVEAQSVPMTAIQPADTVAAF